MKSLSLFLGIFFWFFLSQINAQSIKVYFNQSVDTSVSTVTNAIKAVNLEDTICKYIHLANSTIDVAVWDNGSKKIVDSLNSAFLRGIQVRYITTNFTGVNSALQFLNTSIPRLKRTAAPLPTDSVMHNKFVIIDTNIVMTGSMNFGNGSMNLDYNNFLIIADSSLAYNYKKEFNEMWGSSNANYNIANSRFGNAKTDNTTHNFSIGATPVELYFSPSDNTTKKILNAISTAQHTIDIAMFTFNHDDIGDSIVAAKNRGVIVHCIIENTSIFGAGLGSEYGKLLNNGINVQSHLSKPFDFHHKYCIIDANYQASNPTVVTGSHNWTNSAENEYDENTLIIHDYIIAQQYLEEFSKRFDELTSIAEINDNNSVIIYPNPSNGNIYITNLNNSVKELEIFNYEGKTIDKIDVIGRTNCSIELSNGIYLIKFTSKEGYFCKKIIVQ